MRSFSNSLELRSPQGLVLARVLIVHGDLAPRLALRTILQAGGYAVDIAATPAEAVSRLDENVYELVLSDSLPGLGGEGHNVLAYARTKDYEPATALIVSDDLAHQSDELDYQVAVHTENLVGLLGKVADLIGKRASRRHRPVGGPLH